MSQIPGKTTESDTNGIMDTYLATASWDIVKQQGQVQWSLHFKTSLSATKFLSKIGGGLKMEE